MKAGDVIYARVTVKRYGVAVLGLVLANFAVDGYHGPTNFAPSFTVTEIGSGDYLLAITTNGTAAWHTYKITAVASGVNTSVSPDYWAGWLCTNDADTLYAVVIRPVAVTASGTVVSTELPLSIIANRYSEFSVSVTDQSGTAIDLSGYDTFKFSVWDKTHAAVIYTGTNATGSALGALAWTVPENASFFTQMDAQIAAGNDQMDLYYDLIANKAANAAKTMTLIRGKLTMYRYEGPA